MKRTMTRTAVATVITTLASLILIVGTAGAETIWFCDSNGDGFSDLAVGVPREDLGRRGVDAGVMHEFLSIGRDFVPTGTWRAGRQQGQRFGESMICADFNGDGFGDIVVGRPWVDLPGARDYGRIDVLYGGSFGAGSRIQTISKSAPGMTGRETGGDYFGWDMTFGDFNGDGIDDLAIGAPGESVRGVRDAGAVHVIYGSTRGLRTRSSDVFHQGSPGVADQPETGDAFGEYLTAADFDGDGVVDLAVGAPAEDIGTTRDAGAVTILYGSARIGITGRSAFIHRNTRGVPGTAAAFEYFGAPLFFGDFDRSTDGFELLVGVPGEDVNGRRDAGAVLLLGLDELGRVSDSQSLHTGSPGITGNVQADAQFGRSIIAGDFDDDGEWDVAVGAPGTDIGPLSAAGAVHVIFGDGSGLSRRNSRLTWEQTRDRVAQEGAFFGGTLAAGDFDADGIADVAIGVPFADWARPRVVDGGAVVVLYGSPRGPRGNTSVLLGQGLIGNDVGSPIEPCDSFGVFNPGLRLPAPAGVRADACTRSDRAADMLIPDHLYRTEKATQSTADDPVVDLRSLPANVD